MDELKDRNWRLNNLYKIVNKDGQKTTFQPNWAQQDFIENDKGRDLILKARQLGFTTLACILGLDEAIFKSDWSVLIIAHTLADAAKIFETKIKYPWDNLPDTLKEQVQARNDRAGLLTFNHGSSIQVATSGRSATYQRLHISEFGKICAVYPKKAREIITGSLPAVGKNIVTIESTAEGADGKFFEMCQRAMTNQNLDREDWRFHFYPWYKDDNNVYDPRNVMTTADDELYFAKVQHDNDIKLTPDQMAWWLWQEETLGGDMKRENPSSPAEAFEQAIDGAYFNKQLAFAEKRGYIGRYPLDPNYPVNTFWDLGRNDKTSIWFHQYIDKRNRFIHYYEASGEYVGHYIRYLKEFSDEYNCMWGNHYWPHDGDREDLFLESGRLGLVEEKHNFHPQVVSRVLRKVDGIDKARSAFADCDFDEKECATGLKHLRMYRKEWDDMREVWKANPRHDDASHGADAFMTFACGFVPPKYEFDDSYDKEYALSMGKSLPRRRQNEDAEDYDWLKDSYAE